MNNNVATTKMIRNKEEWEEARRHDKLYGGNTKPWILPEDAWTRFDDVRQPIHGYVHAQQRLGDLRGKRILDLGCGTGWLSVILAKRGATVDAVEISTEAVRIATEMARINGVSEQVTARVGSAYDIEFPDETFDIVVGEAILHHLSDKHRAAEELYRVLKPSGRAIFHECFGESRFLERLRLYVPVPVEDEDSTHWHHQLRYSDVDIFRGLFSVQAKEFQLLSRLTRIVRNKRFELLMGRFDQILLENMPFLRKFARTIVVELVKK